MRSDSDDSKFDDVSDEELERIERELLEAAKEHKLPIGEAEPPDLEPIGDDEEFSKLDELEARAEAMAHRAKVGQLRALEEEEILPSESEQEFERRMKSIEDSAKRARKTEHSRVAPPSKKDQMDQETAHSFGMGLSIAYAVLGLPLLGVVIGKVIDGAGPAKWTQWLALGGIVLGVGFAMFQLSRANRRNN